MNAENNNVFLDEFEEQAMSISSMPCLVSYKSVSKKSRYIASAIFLVLVCASSFLFYQIHQHHNFISQLRADGANVVTVSALPDWASDYISESNPLVSWIETPLSIRLLGDSPSDENLKQLATCSKLKQVEIYGSKLTGLGLKELANSKSLNYVELYACDQIVVKDIADLHSVNAFIKVTRFNRPYVGVLAQKSERGLYEVSWVEEFSPANKAGLQVGDKIARVNRQHVRTMDSIEKLFGDFKPGEDVRMLVWRGNKRLRLKLQVGDILASTKS